MCNPCHASVRLLQFYIVSEVPPQCWDILGQDSPSAIPWAVGKGIYTTLKETTKASAEGCKGKKEERIKYKLPEDRIHDFEKMVSPKYKLHIGNTKIKEFQKL